MRTGVQYQVLWRRRWVVWRRRARVKRVTPRMPTAREGV